MWTQAPWSWNYSPHEQPAVRELGGKTSHLPWGFGMQFLTLLSQGESLAVWNQEGSSLFFQASSSHNLGSPSSPGLLFIPLWIHLLDTEAGYNSVKFSLIGSLNWEWIQVWSCQHRQVLVSLNFNYICLPQLNPQRWSQRLYKPGFWSLPRPAAIFRSLLFHRHIWVDRADSLYMFHSVFYKVQPIIRCRNHRGSLERRKWNIDFATSLAFPVPWPRFCWE